MPVDFEVDDDAIDDTLEEAEEEAEEEKPRQQNRSRPGDIDSRLVEMEERLEMIQYYKTLLDGNFFNDPPNPSLAQKIETEIAQFIVSRLEDLLNTNGSSIRKTESVFSEEEVDNLKRLASEPMTEILVGLANRVVEKSKNPQPQASAAPQAPELVSRTIQAPTLKKASIKKTTKTVKTVQVKEPEPVRPPPAPEPVKQKPAPTQQKNEIQVDEDGRKYIMVMDADPPFRRYVDQQARPKGRVQPKPFPATVAEYEAQMEATAIKQFKTSSRTFDSDLT